MSLIDIMIDQLSSTRLFVEDGGEAIPVWRITTTEGSYRVFTRFDHDKPEQTAEERLGACNCNEHTDAAKAHLMLAALTRGLERVAGVTAAELGLRAYLRDASARSFPENATVCL